MPHITKPTPSQDILKMLLTYDARTGVLTWKKRDMSFFDRDRTMRWWNATYAGKEAFTARVRTGSLCYKNGSILGETYAAHRIIWKLVYGVEPELIDHINGDCTDNRIGNLRSVSNQINCQNRAMRSDNTSGVTGVTLRRGKWRSRIFINGKDVLIGTFASFDEAVMARNKAVEESGFSNRHGRANPGFHCHGQARRG